MLILIAILTFILIVASTWWFGLWSNLITLVNLFLASLVASSIYQPVSQELLNINSSYHVLYDFISVWVIFVITFLILRAATDALSAFRLKFDPLTEMIGRSVLSIWIAGVFICFSFFTLQMAPLAPSMYGAEGQRDQGTMQDKLWLAFVQNLSRGSLSATKAKGMWPEYTLTPHADDEGKDIRVFDPHATFLAEHAEKRQEIADMKRLRTGSTTDE